MVCGECGVHEAQLAWPVAGAKNLPWQQPNPAFKRTARSRAVGLGRFRVGPPLNFALGLQKMKKEMLGRIVRFACLAPMAVCSSFLSLVYLAIALGSRGSDLELWGALLGSSVLCTIVTILGFVRFRKLTFWSSAAVMGAAVVFLAPGIWGTFLMEALARNPP